MKCVVLESPYAGDIEANLEYGRRCIRDSLLRGESPIASHLLYTQAGILDDNIPEERERGMSAGWAWMVKAEAIVVYEDKGISKGMEDGVARARSHGLPVEFRKLDKMPVKEGAYNG